MNEEILAQDIQVFLQQHGKKVPGTNDWTSPDAVELEYYASCLSNGVKPQHPPHSEWGSGGYGRYTDEQARLKHERLLSRCHAHYKSLKI